MFVYVKFDKLQSEDVFVRKLYIKCLKTAGETGENGLKELGKVARKNVAGYEDDGEARKWVEEKWVPHVSLL